MFQAPKPEAKKLKRIIENLGYHTHIDSLSTIVNLKIDINSKPKKIILISSQRAAKIIIEKHPVPLNMPLLVIGDISYNKLKKSGFSKILYKANDSNQLLKYLMKILVTIKKRYGRKITYMTGSVSNQNLQSKSNIEMLIISPDEFILEANRLAEFHRNISSLKVLVVTPQQIYNEFSSGSQDVSAIRDFAKHLYESPGQSLKYLLLFGDASYDPKNRVFNNTNFIPSYQSLNSNSQTASYVSDDFFAILDDGESIGTTSSSLPFLDIGVGRFPVKNINEARTVVDKIFEYYQDESKNPWRLNVCFVADDNDVLETRHAEDADELVEDFLFKNPVFNVDKIYLELHLYLCGLLM